MAIQNSCYYYDSSNYFFTLLIVISTIQCINADGLVSREVSGLLNILLQQLPKVFLRDLHKLEFNCLICRSVKPESVIVKVETATVLSLSLCTNCVAYFFRVVVV